MSENNEQVTGQAQELATSQTQEPEAKKPFFSKKKNVVLVVLAALALILGGLAVWAFIDQPLSDEEVAQLMQTGLFHDNIRINGVEVGGLTASQARERVEKEKNASTATFELEFQLDDVKWKLSGTELKITTDIDNVLKEAMLIEKSGSYWHRFTAGNTLNGKGYDYTITMTPDSAVLKEQADRLAKEATTEPEEPAFKGVDESGKPVFTDGKAGYVVDAAKLLKTMQERFEKQDFSVVEISAKKTEPKMSAEELRKNTVLIGAFTTNYDSSSNREYNIEKAVGILSGTAVQPGEIFDINALLGPRTYAGGWRGANGIVGGTHYEVQPGGGVCQVSTTLFGAVLRADLEVVERKNHSFPSDYVKIGQDATISTGGPNFRFKNTRSGPVYVIMRVDGRKNITAELYGPPHPKGYTVEITSELVSVFYPGATKYTVDPSKPPGYKESVSIYHVGKRSRTYKTYYDKDGKQVGERITIYNDTYPAVRAHYIVGPEPTAAPTAAPTASQQPTSQPTAAPTAAPTPAPTPPPAPEPTPDP